MPRRTFAALALMGTFALTACDVGTEPTNLATESVVPSAARVAAPAPGDAPIAAIAIDAGFTQLVGALAYVDTELGAGLIELFLNGKDQYTVFAPTDEAFEDLYALLSSVLGTEIDEINDVPPEVVLDVLLYHVVEGRRASNSVVPKNRERTITSLLGETFRVRPDLSIEDGLTGLRDDASIATPDITASNGIIHVISGVIVPPSVVAALTS
jgi:uncharacterized surface protein with fasciclin (FAS1) repeats